MYLAVVALAGCATTEDSSRPSTPGLTAAQGRALVARLLPDGVSDRSGWATDIYAAIAVLAIAPSGENLCAAIAITEQESGFRVDPTVPGLATIALTEIERRRERAGIPKLVLDAALAVPSTNGKSYSERLNGVKTELQLSDIYEDFIGRVPFGKTFLAERNPVRTGGPMQVSIAFAEAHAAAKPYPYPLTGNIRHEVFTRRGGVYFGIAHLLDYAAPYDRQIYRFADFNAGRYASRNAAFQNAVTQVSGVPLVLDGDLLRYDGEQPQKEPGSTELAVRTLARRLELSDADIRRDLELGKVERFEHTRLYARVFALGGRLGSSRLPRAVLPQIELQSPKITRKLTTEWFANRVDGRYRACLARYGNAIPGSNPPAL
jgi:hypothetical protein